jgi:hypothetical protein
MTGEERQGSGVEKRVAIGRDGRVDEDYHTLAEDATPRSRSLN